jgi:hypothetical protein
MRYYKRGYEMGCPESTAQIAVMISGDPFLAPELSSRALYQKAASLGHQFAIMICKGNDYPY